jgi:hypothetical protein
MISTITERLEAIEKWLAEQCERLESEGTEPPGDERTYQEHQFEHARLVHGFYLLDTYSKVVTRILEQGLGGDVIERFTQMMVILTSLDGQGEALKCLYRFAGLSETQLHGDPTYLVVRELRNALVAHAHRYSSKHLNMGSLEKYCKKEGLPHVDLSRFNLGKLDAHIRLEPKKENEEGRWISGNVSFSYDVGMLVLDWTMLVLSELDALEKPIVANAYKLLGMHFTGPRRLFLVTPKEDLV